MSIKVRVFDGVQFWYSTDFICFTPQQHGFKIFGLQNTPFGSEDFELSSGLFDNSNPFKKEIYVNDIVTFLNVEETIKYHTLRYETGFVEFLNGQFLINSKELGHQSLYGATNVTVIGYNLKV